MSAYGIYPTKHSFAKGGHGEKAITLIDNESLRVGHYSTLSRQEQALPYLCYKNKQIMSQNPQAACELFYCKTPVSPINASSQR